MAAMFNQQEVSLTEQVDQLLRQNWGITARHRIEKLSTGVYEIDGRTVQIRNDQFGKLVVVDGPMSQPLLDYLTHKDANAQYTSEGLKDSILNKLPKATHVTFADAGNGYSRLDAMKVAKEQANFREKAANYVQAGQMVPQDLIQKYQKTLDMKLGNNFKGFRPGKNTETLAGPTKVPDPVGGIFGPPPNLLAQVGMPQVMQPMQTYITSDEHPASRMPQVSMPQTITQPAVTGAVQRQIVYTTAVVQ